MFLLALTVYSVFQRRIRQDITEQQPMHGSGGRILRKPAVSIILQIFKYRKVVVFRMPDGTRSPPFDQRGEARVDQSGLNESVCLG
ncbi:hypothetical protein EYB31_13195 [Paenibacillus thalictri]|uniref:Uncharacterized protein n=1 Tax=Paenibacillus thalictri TaxID=2527873 RepID=A0A4Q9DSK4_9BACL|nr:hypothetical protein [Paenibacillus thalictri]TBL78459.1 hypothetical protein EYB31_13195 [Paenibacillus thalictri]